MTETPSHPLDPLTADELGAIVHAARTHLEIEDRHLFVAVQLHEPAKTTLAAWRNGDPLDRAARVAVWDSAARRLDEYIITTAGEIRDRRTVPGAMAPALVPQMIAAVEATRADPRVLEGLAGRSVEAIDSVHIEPWPFGGLVPDRYGHDRRLVWTPMWERKTPEDNQYAHPIHGLYAVVDLDTGEVIDVEDHAARPIPKEDARYRQSELGSPRSVAEIQITQPEGRGFTVDGWHIRGRSGTFGSASVHAGA